MDVDSRYIKIFPERLAAYCVVDAAREIALAEGEPLRWFFAISKLHRALSCALVAALRGSAGIGAYPAKGRRLWLTWFDESRTNDIPPPQWDRVDTVSNLMERARDPAELEMSGEPLRLSEDQIRDLDRLNQFRDDLEHIKPRYWLLEVGGLPRVAGAAVEALDQLFMRGSVRLHLGEEELRSALEAIAVIKACAERSPSIAPKCPFENVALGPIRVVSGPHEVHVGERTS